MKSGGGGAGESVSGVVGERGLIEFEKFLNHEDDLLFGSVTVAGNGKFDFIGSKFEEREVMLSGGEQDNATGLSDGDSGGSIFAEEKFLNAQDMWLERINKVVESGVDFKQAFRQGSLRRGSDNAEMKSGEAVAMRFDESESANGSTGVDT